MAQFAIDEILTTGIQISGFVFDRSYSLGTAGQVLTSTSSGVMWQADSSIIDLSALSGQIVSTGALLNNRINSLSGYVNETFVSGSGTQYYVPRWNTSKELVTGSIYDNGFVGIGITNPSGQLHLRNMGFTNQSGIADSNTFPNATGVFGLVMDHNAYTNGLYRHRFIKVDRSSNLPLYLQQAGGVANQYINLVRFGTHSQSTNTFEVFGDSKINGTQSITSNLLVTGNVGVGTTNPAVKLHIENSGTISSIATVRLVGSTGNNAGSQIEFYKAQTPEAAIGLASAVTGGLSDDLLLLSTNPNSIVLAAGLSGLATFKPDGKVGIGIYNPVSLLSIGGAASTSAESGLSFGQDAQANLYRSAEDTIKTDGSLVVAVNATFAGNVGIGLTNPAVKLDVSGGNARFSDYIIIGEDFAYPSNTGSAYLGYTANTSASPQSNLELIDALSNAIGVNDPLRFRATISGQYFSGNNWYADPAPLSYGTLLNGNANSYLDLVTSSEYSVGISGKRFVVDQGTSYTRPNFILLNTDWNQNFWGFKLNVENSNDLINWTNCITEQAFSTNNTKGTIALSIANSIQGGGASRYFRFSFVANQIISAGALRVNKIRSLGNQNYSSTIPVSTSVAGNLIASVGIISPTITSLSGNLAATGSVLDTKINTLSGYSNSTFATITNLAATGSTLDTKINTLSGYSNSTFATITNLAATGSTLDTKINTLSGYSNSTFATITNLAATGSTLDTKINTLSGYANSTFLSGVGVSNYVPRWSGTKLLVTGSIYDLGTGIGIGTISPGTKLDVVGAVTMPVIRQSTTLYAGTDIIDDNSTRTVYFNIPEGGNNPARYFKVARIKINANYQNVSLNGYFTTTNSALHVGFERKVEFDFIAYAATNPGAPQVTYLKRGPDTTNVLVYAVPDGGGAGTTYYDVYIKNGWYNDTNGELAIRVGYSSAVTVWQAGLDSGTSAPVDTLVNPNSNYAFDTAGNVGVGTTNPTVKLHVVGNGLLTNTSAIDLRIDASSLGNASLTIDRQTTAAESKILLLDANISQWGIAAKALSNNFVIRDADSTERFTILKTNGNIGIGTTNPITKFHVYEATNGNNWGLFAGNVGATLPSAYTYGVLIGSNYSNGFSESNIVWGNGISSNQYFAIGRGSGSGFYSEQLRIDVNGDVGIGNTNPTTLLSVGSAGSTSAASGITFGGDSTANLYRSAAGTLKTDGRLNIVGDADDSTPDLFFNGAGGFGSAGGQVRAWSPDNTTLSWYWDNTQFTYNNFPVRVVNASSVVRVYFAPSSDSYINNASNFGIGTNAPGTRLDVRFPTNPATDNGAGNNVLRVWTTAGYAADVGGAIGLGGEYSGGLLQSFGQIAGRKSNGISGNNAGYLQFATTNNGGTMSEWMRIDAGGKVGIGTNAPNYNLDVIGSVRASGELISEGNNARISLFRNNGINYFDWSSGQSLYFSTQTSVGGAGRSTLLAVTSGGNVGIGTLTPNGKLHVVSPDSAFAFSVAGATKGVRFNVNSAGTYIQGVDNTLAGSYQSLVLGGSDLYFQTNGLTNAVYIDSSGDVGINTTSPTSKLNVVETTPTGTRIQLGTNSENALMDANKTVDMLILNAPYGTYSATTSNAGAKWGIKFVGSLEAGQINTIGKTSAIYAVSEDATAGYNRGTSLAFYTNQFNDIPYAERMRIYHNGNIGIGITNPSNKLHISGGGISFTTSTGLAVPMIGLTAVNVAYIGPYTTSTDGNAPTLVVFNQGSSVQQTYFYSSGRIAMVLNKEGRLNIAGNAGNTPPALLNVGPASSVDAVSGMSFGNDSSANLYRSAASTIKTDGNINIVGTATLGPTVVNGGTLPSSPTGSTVVGFNYNVNNGNISQVNFVEKRFATGGDWTTATTRIQKRVDVTDQAYIEFNPSGALYGMALGVAAGGSFEAMRILSNGRIGIGTTNPTAKLSLNKGSKDQFLALDIANNDQKYALYVDQDNNGSNSFSVWDATNSHTAIRYLPSSAGYWQLYTNDIERVRIDNAGNVGVGTTSMVGKLDVYANTDGPLLSFVRNASAGSSAYSAFVLRRDGNNNGIVLFTNSSTRSTDGGTGNSTIRTDYGNLNFGAGGSQHILTTAGNVGINTTTPQYRLDVNSSIVSRSTLSSPRFSSAGTYVYGVTNSPTWVIGTGSSTNNNATAPDGTTSAGTYTLSAVSASFDLYQTISGLTNGRVYTVGMWIKLGTATNFCLVVNNTGAWNTIGGKAFTSSDGLSTSKWTHISYTFAATASGAINLHLGYHAETAVPQQTAGTVFLWNIEMTEFSSTWIGNVEDEIRLPGSSIWTSRGSVGIGQTNPLSKFVVSGGTVNTTTYTTSEARIADGSLHLMKTVAGGIFESIRAMNMDTTAGTTVRVLAASTSDPFNNGNGGKVFIDAIRTATNMDLAFSLNDVAGAAAVERVRFMGNGNVGIGVTNPVYKLQLQANNPNNGVLAQFYNYNAGAAGVNGAFSIWTQYGIADWFIGQPSGVNALTFGRDKTSSATGVEYMRIDAGGNIGIGITNPACKLDVAGTIRSSTNEIYGFGASDNVSLRAASTSNVLGIYTSNVERLRLAANGYFGVGTDNPSTLLSIGRAGSTAATSGITFGADSQANLYRISNARIKTDGNFTIDGQGGGATSLVLNRSSTSSENGMAFNTAGSVDWYFFINDGGTDLQIQRSSEIDSAPRVRFNGSNKDILFNLGGGNIGVGTSIPTGKVHIVSSIVGETVLRADGTNGTLFSVVDDLSDSLMSVNNSAGLPVLEVFADDRVVAGQYGSGDFVVANNKVGIGTTNPINKLSVIGAASIGSTSYNIAAPTNGLLVEGNVGIGTTSVGNPLEVYGTSMDPSLTPSAASIFSVNSLGVELAVGRMVTSPFSIWLQGKHATVGGNLTYPIVLNPLGGNVGIGVTNPIGTYGKLSVAGGIRILDDNNGKLEIGRYSSAASDSYIKLGSNSNSLRITNNTDAADIFTILNGGNVGIGTISPNYLTDIQSTSSALTLNLKLNKASTTNDYAEIAFQLWAGAGSGPNTFGGAGNSRAGVVLRALNENGTSAAGAFIIGTFEGGSTNVTLTEKFRLASNGNVGIGTNVTPLKLNVSGSIYMAAGSGSAISWSNDISSQFLKYDSVTDGMVLSSWSHTTFLTQQIERVRITSNGNVGIGTTNPAHKLEVFNTANSQTYVRVNNQDTGGSAYAGLDLQSYGGGWQVRVPASTTFVNPLLFSFNEAERARITSDGKVGIGTTNPVATLDIENPASNLPILNLGGGEAGNAVSDLYVINSYNNNTGVGYAAKVIGVNISGSLTATNIPVQRTVWGGVTSATAIALGTDGPRAGAQDNAFQIWTTNDGVAGTQLTQKFSVSSAGDVGIGIVTPTDKIQISGGGISLTTSTGLAVPMLGMTPLNIAYVGPYNTPTDGNAPSTVLFNHGASVQQTWFYSSGSIAMVLNRQGRLHIGNNNNAPNCLLSVGPNSSTTAVSGMCFGNDAQANLYRSAEDTIKTDGNLSVAGTLTVGGAVSLNGHIYGNKSVTLSTASWTTVLTVNMLAHNSCYVKIGAFGDWSNHSAIAFVSELFIQNGNNSGYGEPGTIITAHDNTAGAAGDKIDIQIVDPAAAGTQNFLIQLKLISATSSTNSSIITYHVMGQQASVT